MLCLLVWANLLQLLADLRVTPLPALSILQPWGNELVWLASVSIVGIIVLTQPFVGYSIPPGV